MHTRKKRLRAHAYSFDHFVVDIVVVGKKEVSEMLIQSKAEHKGDSRILNLDSLSRIQTASLGEHLITVDAISEENGEVLIGIYPERVEGLVMANIAEQIKEQILAGVSQDDLFIVAPEESELVEPEC